MSITTYGWLVLLCPLAGAVLIGLTFKALPQRVHGVHRHARDLPLVPERGA